MKDELNFIQAEAGGENRSNKSCLAGGLDVYRSSGAHGTGYSTDSGQRPRFLVITLTNDNGPDRGIKTAPHPGRSGGGRENRWRAGLAQASIYTSGRHGDSAPPPAQPTNQPPRPTCAANRTQITIRINVSRAKQDAVQDATKRSTQNLQIKSPSCLRRLNYF